MTGTGNGGAQFFGSNSVMISNNMCANMSSLDERLEQGFVDRKLLMSEDLTQEETTIMVQIGKNITGKVVINIDEIIENLHSEEEEEALEINVNLEADLDVRHLHVFTTRISAW